MSRAGEARSRGGRPGRALRDRRGAVALVVAVAAGSVVGMAAFATDAGSWYLARRNAQNAADAAALAAARVFADTTDNAAGIAAGQDVSARNGFANGAPRTTVEVLRLADAVAPRFRASIAQQQPLVLAAAVLNTPQVVRATAVAEALAPPGGGACSLTLEGATRFGGTGSLSAPGCALASNAEGNSFQFGSGNSLGGSAFTASAWSLVGAGDSASFLPAQQDGQVTLTGPQPAFRQQPIRNPYAALDSYTPATDAGLGALAASATCTPFTVSPRTGAAVPNSPSLATPFRSTSLTGNGQRIVLSPGTYFVQGSFSTNPGTFVTCSGCGAATGAGVTIVVLGRTRNGGWTPGTLDIKGTVQLNAPRTNTVNANMNGVLFYVPGGGDVDITANSTTSLAGAIVAPQSEMTLIGNATSAATPISDCTVLITGSLEVTGTAALSLAGCESYGTGIPQIRIVRLIE